MAIHIATPSINRHYYDNVKEQELMQQIIYKISHKHVDLRKIVLVGEVHPINDHIVKFDVDLGGGLGVIIKGPRDKVEKQHRELISAWTLCVEKTL